MSKPEGLASTDMVSLAKAMVISEDGGTISNATEQVDDIANDVLKAAGVVIPPYDPGVLALICENSSALRPNIDAYVINIDSYGHTLKPLFDLDAQDIDIKIADALRYENKKEPTQKEIDATKEQLRKDIPNERQRLEAFFENCAYDMQFSGPEGLRGLTRMDLETTGNAYWEVLRNTLGEVTGFLRLPAVSMSMTRHDLTLVETRDVRRTSPMTTKVFPMMKRFRRYVQRYANSSDYVFYKEFGDPRAISAKTGKPYADEEMLAKEEPGAAMATEVIAFKISSARTEYGVPRWIGVLLAVLGSRQAEEINFLYFENKSIPPLAVLVNGGRLSSDSTKRLEEYIKGNIKGKKNFHNVLILEADSAQVGAFNVTSADTDPGKMRITLQPLTDAQQKDGLFLNYDERNMDKVGMTFRLPRLLRGDIRDFNRSTSVAALDFAEVQVFSPLRQQFDFVMNRLMVSVLGAKYHEFISNAATITDPEALSTMIKMLTEANVLTPEEGRELAEEVFHRQFIKIDALWTQQPVGITVSGANAIIAAGGDANAVDSAASRGQGQAAGALSVDGAGPTQASMGAGRFGKASLAKALTRMHKLMVEGERENLAQMEEEIIKVPADEFYKFFAKE